jgi:hypothetical protein
MPPISRALQRGRGWRAFCSSIDQDTQVAIKESDRSARHRILPIEHELSIHLERAHELAERAQRSNDAVQHEIDRALEIFDRLRGHVSGSSER